MITGIFCTASIVLVLLSGWQLYSREMRFAQKLNRIASEIARKRET